PRRSSLGWRAQWLTALATLFMAVAPFTARAAPVMSSYVPVLDNDVFLYGLMVLGAGFRMLTLRSFVARARMSLQLDGADALRFGLKADAVSSAVALMAMAWLLVEVPRELEPRN